MCCPDVLTQVLRALAFPKQMHWDAQLDDGKGELVFGRPIRWLLFLYGGRVVPFTIARLAVASSPRVQDVTSGAVTYGHRFLATTGRAGRAIKVRSFEEYRKKLGENFVLLSRIERHDRILRDLDVQARRVGGRPLLQQHPQAQALLEEVPDLVEFPTVVAGAFDPEFLSLPEEVLTTTLIHHQHFFPVTGSSGALMPAFLAITNTQSGNDRAIAINAERVVTARLRDARFFWNADRQVTLEQRLNRLETLVFHKAVGSYRQKAERIERLARWIATSVLGEPEQAESAARAARLAKADLATEMVGEFPELQGVMGGVYAREAGEPEAVWKAIYSHYLPIGVEAAAPPALETLGEGRVTWAAVSLADKLDTLVGLFLAGERPTGSRDPFGLRRQAHGALKVLLDIEGLAPRAAGATLGAMVTAAVEGFAGLDVQRDEALDALGRFLSERLGFALEQRGAAARNVRAVLRDRGLGEIAPGRLEHNVTALGAFAETESFRQLAAAFKRVRNIARELQDARECGLDEVRAALEAPAELALCDEIAARREQIDRATRADGDFRAAYTAAAGFQPAVDRFFAEVFVMVDDVPLRLARLRLMKRLEQLILQLGDISEIVAAES